MSEQELKGIEIVRDEDKMIAMIPIKLTEAKFQILLTAAKAQGIDLAKVIEIVSMKISVVNWNLAQILAMP